MLPGASSVAAAVLSFLICLLNTAGATDFAARKAYGA